MSNEFRLDSELKESGCVIGIHGYLNNLGGAKLVEEFDVYHKNGTTNYIFDMADCKVVNSMGISFIIEIIEKLNESKGKLAFVNLDPTIEKTLTIMGIFQYSEKAENVEDGIKLF